MDRRGVAVLRRWTAHRRARIRDAALLLDGMAFTEAASADFPWIEMVRWTTDFVTSELRRHWTDEQWREVSRRR